MLKFLVDEDLPRSTTHLLREMGFVTLDVKALNQLAEDDLKGNLVIIEPTKTRIRRHEEKRR